MAYTKPLNFQSFKANKLYEQYLHSKREQLIMNFTNHLSVPAIAVEGKLK